VAKLIPFSACEASDDERATTSAQLLFITVVRFFECALVTQEISMQVTLV